MYIYIYIDIYVRVVLPWCEVKHVYSPDDLSFVSNTKKNLTYIYHFINMTNWDV